LRLAISNACERSRASFISNHICRVLNDSWFGWGEIRQENYKLQLFWFTSQYYPDLLRNTDICKLYIMHLITRNLVCWKLWKFGKRYNCYKTIQCCLLLKKTNGAKHQARQIHFVQWIKSEGQPGITLNIATVLFPFYWSLRTNWKTHLFDTCFLAIFHYI